MSHSRDRANAASLTVFINVSSSAISLCNESGAAVSHSKNAMRAKCAPKGGHPATAGECGPDPLGPLFNFESRRDRYMPRLNSNRYSNNKIIAPTIDMIQPAT